METGLRMVESVVAKSYAQSRPVSGFEQRSTGPPAAAWAL